MGIKVKYGLLRNPEFLKSLRTLALFRGVKHFESLKRIHLICKSLDPLLKDVADLHTKLVEVYAVKDAEGRIAPISEDQPSTFKISEENVDAWIKALKEFDETEVSLLCEKVCGTNLDGLELNSQEYSYLSEFLE
jgi:hypothetical protein